MKYLNPDGRYSEVSLNLVPSGDPNGSDTEKRDYDLNQKFKDVSTYWGTMTVAIPDKEVIPCKLDSLSPGYELSSTGVIKSGQKQEPRIFKKFEYKKI